MSVSDIEEEMKEIYGINLSTSAISIITNKVSLTGNRMAKPPIRQSLFDCLDGRYCVQSQRQRQSYQQDSLSLRWIEQRGFKRSLGYVGWKDRKCLLLARRSY